MELLSIIVTILTALLVWRVNFEHNIAITYYALTKNIVRQLRSLSHPFGGGSCLELAKSRVKSFDYEVLPYLIEWRIAAEKFNVVFTEKKHKQYSDTVEILLDGFKNAIITLYFPLADKKATLEAESLLYGTDKEYTKQLNEFLKLIETNFNPILKHPYSSYISKFLGSFPM